MSLSLSPDSKVLVLAQHIPQVYVAVGLLPLLAQRLPHLQINVVSSAQHFSHFQSFVGASAGHSALQLTSEWPTPEQLNEISLLVYLGHSYFLDDGMLVRLAQVTCPIYWLNAHFETDDLFRWRQHGPNIAGIFQHVFYEDKQDEANLLASGFAVHSLHFVGSAKYDGAAASPAQIALAKHNLACVTKGNIATRVIVAASIAEVQEMALFVDAFKTLSTRHSPLLLVLAPRCMERIAEFADWLNQQTIGFCRSSACTPSAILLLDEVGVLKGYYHCANVALMGRSFFASSGGGSNLLEAAAAGLPIVCGPFMAAFQSVVAEFLQHKALLQLDAPEQLCNCLFDLFEDAAGAAEYGRRAKALVKQGEGVLQRCVDFLAERSQA